VQILIYPSSRKLISAPKLSKHFTIAQCPRCDATNKGDSPRLLRKLIAGKSPSFVAISAGYYDIVRLLRAHGALRKDNMKTHNKTISKGTNDTEIIADGNALLNTCGYPEEEISHSTEKREEGDFPSSSRKLISAPKLSKQFTIAQCPRCDATNKGDSPRLLRKLIAAPELSKHLTTSQCPDIADANNGD
jgi:phage FluMu protein Com